MQNKITTRVDLVKVFGDNIEILKLVAKHNRVNRKEYLNKEGEKKVALEVEFDIVPLNIGNQRFISEGDTWRLIKTHFVSLSPTKEERASQTKTPIVGDGRQFISKENQSLAQDNICSDGTDASKIPF